MINKLNQHLKLPFPAFTLFAFMLVFTLLSCGKKEEPFDPSKESIFDQFVNDGIVDLAIETDFFHFFENKDVEKYQPATLVFTGQDGHSFEKEISVGARGVTRKRICEFPPLKFWFSKEELKSEDLQDFHTLKLVTHCSDSLVDEQLLFKEYLVYRIFNLLTEHSFRVQLARVKYVDVSNHYPSQEKYAFLIENNKEMAARLQGKLLKQNKYQLKTINKDNYNLLVLFQYMVGNTDWNLSRFHNIKLVLPHESDVPLAIPYDFDYSGLVNAPYAVPYASLPIKHVRERFLQWRGKDVSELESAIQLFLQKKEDIITLCHDFYELDEAARVDIVDYLESFFLLLENPGKLVKAQKEM